MPKVKPLKDKGEFILSVYREFTIHSNKLNIRGLNHEKKQSINVK